MKAKAKTVPPVPTPSLENDATVYLIGLRETLLKLAAVCEEAVAKRKRSLD